MSNYLVYGKIMNLLWQIFYTFGRNFVVLNGQILKKIIQPSGHTDRKLSFSLWEIEVLKSFWFVFVFHFWHSCIKLDKTGICLFVKTGPICCHTPWENIFYARQEKWRRTQKLFVTKRLPGVVVKFKSSGAKRQRQIEVTTTTADANFRRAVDADVDKAVESSNCYTNNFSINCAKSTLCVLIKVSIKH